MGYRGYGARVRDESLPRSHRLSALGSCLQHSQAMDYPATWTYLERRLGRARRDSGFPILEALAAVDDERRLRAVAEAEYAVRRRAQKATPRRQLRLTEVTPSSPRRWFGDEVRAARHVLATRPTGHASLVTGVDPAADAAAVNLLTAGPPTDPTRLAALQALLARARHHRELPTLLVLEQVHLATYGGLPMGADWGFTSSGVL
ncbi:MULTISPECIES: hypothetical protein [unclassified Nocardioides]|uniref:hypothetical protein n=1 Tax=unclassified Nocardioides TaxID=2615069 RepID=UPI003014FAB8